MRAVAILVALAACGSSHATPDAAPDAYPGITYAIIVNPSEPTSRPARTPAPELFIDGEPHTTFELHYASFDDAVAASHVVELRANNTVVAQFRTTGDELRTCADHQGALPTRAQFELCGYDSGDLRYFATSVTSERGGCVGDGFCSASCAPGAPGCPAGQHCTSRAALVAPLYSHLACAPVGSAALGEQCALHDDPLGAYDDCADGLLCVAGTCRQVCTATSATCTCSYVEGQPPELRVCL